MRVATASLGLSLTASQNFRLECALSGALDKAHYLDTRIIQSEREIGHAGRTGNGVSESLTPDKAHKLSRKASSFGDGRHFLGAAGSSPARFQKASSTSRFI